MKFLKHGLLAAILAVVGSVALAATASAGFDPNPYTLSSADTITFTTNTALGTGRCTVTNIRGELWLVDGEYGGEITGADIVECSGPITSATLLPPVTITGELVVVDGVDRVVLSADVAILVVNFVGGHCLYAGTLTGSAAVPGNRITLSNPSVSLIQRLGSSIPIIGICSDPADANLNIGLARGIEH